MTKEELEKEAEEYALKQWEGNIPWSVIQKSYYDGALPREKRIADLEAQIEKMKCCYNCKHSRTEYEHCRTDKSENWEIK